LLAEPSALSHFCDHDLHILATGGPVLLLLKRCSRVPSQSDTVLCSLTAVLKITRPVLNAF
jgi:hypothetical protein